MHMALSIKRLFIKHQKKLTDDQQIRFLQRLERFLSHGYSLIDALQAITWDKELKETSENIITLLKDGMPLDACFERIGFHSSISSFLYFTRAHSNLQENIRKCEEMYALQVKNIQKFKQIIRYPLILLTFFSIIIFFINQQVLPSFQALLQSSADSLATIQFSILMIDLFTVSLIVSALLIIGSVIGLRIVKKQLPIEEQVKFYARIPIYRQFLTLTTSFQFAIHFSSLIKSGLPLKDILLELKNQKTAPILAYYADLLITDLNRGFHISSLLSELFFINKQLAIIFQKNSNIAALEKDLSLYSEMILDEIQRKITQTITWIQPIFYSVIGVFIIFIYLSIMWPMLQLINTF